MAAQGPAVVQSDRTILLEVDHPRYEDARDALAPFADLEKSPEHVHTYRITPLSLWNAAAAGLTADDILRVLDAHSRYPVPENLRRDIVEYVGRYGQLQLHRDGDRLVLRSRDPVLLTQIWNQRQVQPYLEEQVADGIYVAPGRRGHLKQALIKVGWPVEDLAGYTPGAPLDISLRAATRVGSPFALRPYQREAADRFWKGGGPAGGSGVVVLPCGAGKTIVGLSVLAQARTRTLILCTGVTAARQWRDELLDKTSLLPDDIGEYTGEEKQIRPVTVSTYQVMTHHPRKSEDFPHLKLFDREDWGLIIYDEVHLLPAPVFRATAEIQARRRLGLTATLVREDGREDDVFSLIGPKRYDVAWKVLEKQGWIAEATCHEIRVRMPEDLRLLYAVSDERSRFRLASENPAKIPLVHHVVKLHLGNRTVHGRGPGERILVIGQFLEQLAQIAESLGAPLITGTTPNREREKLYRQFREGDLRLLVVSKVANFALDLPEASVAIQVSGTFGSRQEEAQRLGRILRPKASGIPATFYTLVSRETKEQDFAQKRQLFLTEQGYRYSIHYDQEVLAGRAALPPASEPPPPAGAAPLKGRR
ncbi:MAG: helicase-associated domain-containing protein [Bacillota bacterium]|nr:helicase-associated domain-containing protein [Bacillota bacterium]